MSLYKDGFFMYNQHHKYIVEENNNESQKLEVENEHLLKMRLFALWEAQEAKRNPKLREELKSLEEKSQSEYKKNQVLQADLDKLKKKLSLWENQLIHHVKINIPSGISIQNLYLSNESLKNEIRQLYDGKLDNFQLLETKARNMRMSNNNLESEIKNVSLHLFNYIKANEALSSEIQETNVKIKGIQDFLQNKLLELQLPWAQATYSQSNRDFLKGNKESKCDVCFDKLNDSTHAGLIVVTPCGHRFHEHCIIGFINSQFSRGISPLCPSCKDPISEEGLVYQNEWNNMKPLNSCFHLKI
jgi:hypothetical protein